MQLSQLELRKALCEFVQDYAKYASEIKEKNADTLARFETVIFSNIVMSDEKMPSVFEGIDQLSNLMRMNQAGK
ncbi:hypothetical protein [Janthinobacterium agaricidamnosum]|uniref:hypothetical protein n=1 Tax=Janthinobacterium agaricidamnosum TaxID=55508 RepID=UPI0013CEE9FC|nr:hypothetical protein [Janthinobacterium agaricidamnosum]